MHIKTDDMVVVLSGDDVGKRGRVLKIDRKAGKVVVEGINKVFRHMRKSQRNPRGGRLSKEAPLALCKVMLVCSACNTATRTGVRRLDDGGKERYCKKCGAGIGRIAPPKKG